MKLGLGVDWYAPKRKRPIGHTTVASSDALVYVAQQEGLVRPTPRQLLKAVMASRLKYDHDVVKVLQSYIDLGYPDIHLTLQDSAGRTAPPEENASYRTYLARHTRARLSAYADKHCGVGSGYRNRIKTHCVKGHAFTPENTYTRPGTNWRECRKCKAAYRERRRGGMSVEVRNYAPGGVS